MDTMGLFHVDVHVHFFGNLWNCLSFVGNDGEARE